MAEIQPFRGVFYNTQRVNPGDVLTQPYDKITPEMRERYLKLSPYNLVQIELGKEQPGDTETNNKYTRARDYYRRWVKEGVLRRSANPALYYLEQSFASPDGSGKRTRRGLIAAVRLHRWGEGVVLPHEHTLSKPKADRISLLREVGSQQGQIFMLHPQPIPKLGKLGAPLYELVDDYQVITKVYELTDPTTIHAIQAAIAPQKLYIADGHHRYETSLAFRDEAGTEASQYVMATLVDMNDPGLVVLPTHRTVGNLTGFDRKSFAGKLEKTFEIIPQSSPKVRAHEIGMFDGGGYSKLRPENLDLLEPLFASKPPLWDTLDVAILHVAILEAILGIDEQRLRDEANVTYWREPEKAVAEVKAGRAQLAFFLAPTPVSDVKAIADAHSRMPQKSTDFFPKLLSGLVIYEVR
ncbi:MAG TPA: DUF1015 domain-containing protein [Verrucomicrobiae bacterium]|nr:DUF1015 domain-containing protein [Verrucomicrobiae bacterium]